ncbi:MAG TPA: energy transducer TonB [Blastocatellia bacterium]|jgi:hypothetical protein
MPRLLILTLSILAISASAQAPQSAPNFNGRPVIKVSTKVLEKKAITKVKPVAPVGVTASGVVRVRVWIDALEGKVVKAKVINGHPILRDRALSAAAQWKWEPLNDTQPIIAVGILKFDFPQK